MLIQSSHSRDARGVDAYFTPPEATAALLQIEAGRIPERLWEPACGDGAIVRPLVEAGHTVCASDIIDHGFAGELWIEDYLDSEVPPGVEGIVTNPPYRLARQFAEKAISEVDYAAFLLRLNFLESVSRLAFFRKNPPARVWVSSRRLPMMHRLGWDGPRASSNTCHAWFIWDIRWQQPCQVGWFDWRDSAK